MMGILTTGSIWIVVRKMLRWWCGVGGGDGVGAGMMVGVVVGAKVVVAVAFAVAVTVAVVAVAGPRNSNPLNAKPEILTRKPETPTPKSSAKNLDLNLKPYMGGCQNYGPFLRYPKY